MYNILHKSLIIEPIETNGRLSICKVKSKSNFLNVNDTIVVKTYQIIKRELSKGTVLIIKEKHILGTVS